MKVVATLHPSYIQRGNWPSLALLRNDLERALRESLFPERRVRPVQYDPAPSTETVRSLLRLGDSRPLYLDIETLPNEEGNPIICCGVGRQPYEAVCFPWRDPFRSLLRSCLLDPSCDKVAHNAVFDFPRLALDLCLDYRDIPRWVDTMQMHAVLEPDLRHGLAHLGLDYYDGAPWKGDEEQTLEIYNCKDVDVMARAFIAMSSKLEQHGLTSTYRSNMRLLPILTKAKDWGVAVHQVRMATIRTELETEIAAAANRVGEVVEKLTVRRAIIAKHRADAAQLVATAEANWVPGKKREMGKLKTKAKRLLAEVEKLRCPNMNSPKQLQQLLYDDLGLPVQRRKDADGNWKITTDDDALIEIARRTQHPVVEAIRQHRDAQSHIKYVKYEDPILHPTWQPHGTASGRLSCIEPNLQNTPARSARWGKIRALYTPVHEGWMYTAVDYSQIERRIQGVLSKDPVLLEAFAAGRDIHSETAALALSIQRGVRVEPEDVTKQERHIFKRAVYLESYGGGYLKLMAVLVGEGIYVTAAQAKAVLGALKGAHPRLYAWRDEILAQVKRQHYLRNVFGRIRWFLGPAFGDALNFPPQSTAAAVINDSMIELGGYHDGQKWVKGKLPAPAIMVAQVHDELIVEHPPSIAEEVKRVMQTVMERPIPELGDWSCPTDAKQGNSWLFDAEAEAALDAVAA